MHEIKLTKHHSNEPIYINLNYWYIQPLDVRSGGGSIITFSADHWVSVVETPEEIFKIMKEARRLL